MLMQRNLVLRIREVTDRVAALRKSFPKPDIQKGANSRNSNRTFAAPVSGVSVADKAPIRCGCPNFCFGDQRS
jgi:hypothetical protein